MRFLFVVILITLVLTTPASAQQTSTSITPDNAEQMQLMTRLGKGFVHDVAWHPDGHLMVASATGIWEYDLLSPNQLPQLFDVLIHVQRGQGPSAFFSEDGSRLFVLEDIPWGGLAKAISVWDTTSWQQISSYQHSDDIQGSPMNYDGSTMSIILDSGWERESRVLYWDTESGETISEFRSERKILYNIALWGERYSILYTWEGDSGSGTGYLTIVDFVTGNIVGDNLYEFASAPHGFLSSPNGLYGAFLERNNSSTLTTYRINIADSENSDHQQVLNNHTGPIAWSMDSNFMATVSLTDNAINIWDLNSGQIVSQLHAALDMTQELQSMVFSPDGSKLLTIDATDKITIWNLLTNESEWQILDFGAFKPLAFDAEQGILYTVACGNNCHDENMWSGRLVEWSVADGQVLESTHFSKDFIIDVDLQVIALANELNRFQLVDLSSKTVIKEIEITRPGYGVSTMEFTTDNSFLVVTLGAGAPGSFIFQFYDLLLGLEEAELYTELETGVNFPDGSPNIILRPNSSELYVTYQTTEYDSSGNYMSTNYHRQLFDFETRELRDVPITELESLIMFHPSGDFGLTLIPDVAVSKVDLETGDFLGCAICGLDQYSDYETPQFFSQSGDIWGGRLWFDLRTGRSISLPTELEYWPGTISSVVFSHNDTVVAFSRFGGQTELWSIDATNRNDVMLGLVAAEDAGTITSEDTISAESNNLYISNDEGRLFVFPEITADSTLSTGSDSNTGSVGGTSLSVTPTTVTEPIQCEGAPVSRLVIGETARVTPGDANNVRDMPTSQGTRIGQIPGGASFDVLDGPVCAEGYAWWQVDYEGLVGWTVEGLIGEYWLEPESQGG